MKFAKTFEKVLTEEPLPEEWTKKAIRYKALKKIIKKTVSELESVGFSRDDMTIDYEISKTKRRLRPVLLMNVSPYSETLIVNKLESMGYKYKIEPISGHIEKDHDKPATPPETPPNSKQEDYTVSQLEVPSADDTESVAMSIEESAVSYMGLQMQRDSSTAAASAINPFDDKPYYRITVSLHEDAKFFQMLYEEIEELNGFSSEKESELVDWIEKIGQIVAKVSDPEVKKNDLYVWRQIFQIYIDSQIFFSTIERSPGELDSNASKVRWGKFLAHIEKDRLVHRFRLKKSLEVFMQFKQLNESILQVSNFQALNMLAISKILKKFDKRTHFKSKQIFPQLMEQDGQAHLLEHGLGKDICRVITNRLLNIVPQVDDYLCPVCCSIAYKPIRLACNHIFCVRCLVKLQRKDEHRCPLCRQDVVMRADARNLDPGLMEYLQLYFPKEVKEKQAETEKEIFKEQFGSVVDPDKACVIM